jgi:hypothetical protein
MVMDFLMCGGDNAYNITEFDRQGYYLGLRGAFAFGFGEINRGFGY